MKKLLSALLACALLLSLVIPAAASDERVDKIRMNRSRMDMTTWTYYTLSVSFTPSSSSDIIEWHSSDSSVVFVDGYGTVYALKRGDAVITAKTATRGLSTTCHITVRDEGQTIVARERTMNVPSITVRVDQTRSLWVNLNPVNSTEDIVSWTSSNTDVAEVDPDGIVTGIAPGTAIITAETDYGSTITCEVTVPDKAGTAREVKVSQAQNSAETLTAAATRTAVSEAMRITTKGSTATATFKNKSAASTVVLNAAAYEASDAGRDVMLCFTTTDENGKVLGSMTFDVQDGKKRESDLKTAVYVDSKKVQSARESFKKTYKNKAAILQCTQTGSFGFPVEITAKVDLSGMNKENLHFYTYSASADTYKALTVDSVSVDKSGKLHFVTGTGGVIVVSDGELTKK